MKREVSERINKLNRENTDLGILVVFLMFSAVKHFKIYWFFFFHFPHHTHTRTLTLFICHNEPSSPCGDLLWEHAFSDNPQPYQCYPQQVHRGKIVAWCTFWYIIYLWFIGRITLKINTVVKKSYHKAVYFCGWSMDGLCLSWAELVKTDFLKYIYGIWGYLRDI